MSTMEILLSGNDQFNLITCEQLSNSFRPVNKNLKLDFIIEDCTLEWDLILYSKLTNHRKTWHVKGIKTGPIPVQIFPPQLLEPKSFSHHSATSKAVICGKTVYILDQESHKLYCVNLQQLFRENNNVAASQTDHELAPETESIILECSEVDFLKGNKGEFALDSKSYINPAPAPEIIDISSTGKDCFAIDSCGGVYKVPNLLWRLTDISFRSIHSGFSFHVLVTDTGAIYTWGNGSRGELGQRLNTIECDYPKRVDFFDDLPSIVTSICCGGWHTLALTSDGDVYSWGWNESGQLGHSTDKLSSITSDPYPIDLGCGDDPIVAISAGVRHSFAVLQSGRVYSWGFNKFGQLALGDNEDRLLPTEVDLKNLARNSDLSHSKNVKVQCGRWMTLLRMY